MNLLAIDRWSTAPGYTHAYPIRTHKPCMFHLYGNAYIQVSAYKQASAGVWSPISIFELDLASMPGTCLNIHFDGVNGLRFTDANGVDRTAALDLNVTDKWHYFIGALLGTPEYTAASNAPCRITRDSFVWDGGETDPRYKSFVLYEDATFNSEL